MGYTIETGWYCSSWFASYEVTGSKGDVYVVTLGGGEAPAHCQKKNGEPCLAYKFSGQDMFCKHIAEVHKGACLMNCQWHDGNDPVTLHPLYEDDRNQLPADDPCPNCGGRKTAVRIAV